MRVSALQDKTGDIYFLFTVNCYCQQIPQKKRSKQKSVQPRPHILFLSAIELNCHPKTIKNTSLSHTVALANMVHHYQEHQHSVILRQSHEQYKTMAEKSPAHKQIHWNPLSVRSNSASLIDLYVLCNNRIKIQSDVSLYIHPASPFLHWVIGYRSVSEHALSKKNESVHRGAGVRQLFAHTHGPTNRGRACNRQPKMRRCVCDRWASAELVWDKYSQKHSRQQQNS